MFGIIKDAIEARRARIAFDTHVAELIEWNANADECIVMGCDERQTYKRLYCASCSLDLETEEDPIFGSYYPSL